MNTWTAGKNLMNSYSLTIVYIRTTLQMLIIDLQGDYRKILIIKP